MCGIAAGTPPLVNTFVTREIRAAPVSFHKDKSAWAYRLHVNHASLHYSVQHIHVWPIQSYLVQ